MENNVFNTSEFGVETLNDNDDDEPPEVLCDTVLSMTFVESNNACRGGKHRSIIRIVNTFNEQTYIKPFKCDYSHFNMHRTTFSLRNNNPEGEIIITLLQHNLPPLPPIPTGSISNRFIQK